jgi:hypothetical protein
MAHPRRKGLQTRRGAPVDGAIADVEALVKFTGLEMDSADDRQRHAD